MSESSTPLTRSPTPTPSSTGLLSVGTTAGTIELRTTGRASGNIVRTGATVGVTRLKTAGRFSGKIV